MEYSIIKCNSVQWAQPASNFNRITLLCRPTFNGKTLPNIGSLQTDLSSSKRDGSWAELAKHSEAFRNWT